MSSKGLSTVILADLNRYYSYHGRDITTEGKTAIIRGAIIHLVFSRGFRAIFYYRLRNHAEKKNIRFLGGVIGIIDVLSNSIEIHPRARIGPGLFMPHPQCIVIGAGAVLGSNVTINQGVTVGASPGKEIEGQTEPVVEDNVLLGAGAKVLGPVTIGANAMIGANAVVVRDIPAWAVAVGVPAEVVNRVETPYHELLERAYQREII
ncbi:serine O-acetyltransferase [Methanofollis sp. W23]|uniref:serine O-acetyltransferase n=1 Tax=Methanofollis sp. W23 TaxID=2817849 RepID=UPI001AE2FC0C|nr:serine O-acetyltransferase [Methanofollis sp. W23]MBP2146918.1 serine O-acetyltransferase [Methanofollis sp. W23]